MENLRTLLIQFNRPFWIYYLVFTFLGIYIVTGGGVAALVLALPLKLVGYAGSVAYQNYFSPQVYFYYRNAGVTIRKLYFYTFFTDMIFFVLLVILSLKFTN